MTTTASVATISLKDFFMHYEIIPVIDKSGSMLTDDMPGGKRRYEAMEEAVCALCDEMSQHDADGLDAIFFSGKGISTHKLFNFADAKSAFATNRPGGSTPMAQALVLALSSAQAMIRNGKKVIIPIFFDGVPDSTGDVESLIAQQANQQANDEDLTMIMIQVGSNPDGKNWLQRVENLH